MRLLLDEMLPAAIAQQLRNRGHDVVAVAELLELRGLPDDELFDHAQRDGHQTIGPLVTSLEAFVTAKQPYSGFVHWLRQPS